MWTADDSAFVRKYEGQARRNLESARYKLTLGGTKPFGDSYELAHYSTGVVVSWLEDGLRACETVEMLLRRLEERESK